MDIQTGKHYMIYGKMLGMERFRPVYGDQFVTKRIHGEMYSPRTEDDIVRLKRELAFMQTQGQFELREVLES